MDLKVVIEAWATIQSKGGKPSSTKKYEDPDLSATLEKVAKKWGHDQPRSEFSILTAKGEIIYVGRYPEGVVLRTRDDNYRAVYLTWEMAKALSDNLAGLSI